MTLRRKVINRIKPKTLHGKRLTGSMLLTLGDSYVSAINEGAVPNIESAWTYICKSECQKAVENSFAIFEDEFKAIARLPCEEEELKDAYTKAKKEAMILFSKKAVGSVEEFENQLKERMKHMFATMKKDNETESWNECVAYL